MAIPVTIICGFLGAGKTTLLNRLLMLPELSDTAVVVNEFGEIALDQLLVERADESIVELSNGCLCCSVRGELVDLLVDLSTVRTKNQERPVQRIVIETTGLADPVPVLQAIMAHPVLTRSLRLDGVVTVVDAVNWTTTLDRFDEAVRQIVMADRIVIAKGDLQNDRYSAERLLRRLSSLNSTAQQFHTHDPNFEPSAILGCGLPDPPDGVRRISGEDNVTSGSHLADKQWDWRMADPLQHVHRYRSFCLVHDRPVSMAAVDSFLEHLGALDGGSLLRMKAIVHSLEDPGRPLVLHSVQNVIHTPIRLSRWSDDDHSTRIVVVVVDIAADRIRRLFEAIFDRPSIDTPDRAALDDNPLAIPGVRF